MDRHRLHRGGDRAANSALYTIVLTRLRYDSRTQQYMARRTAQGLSKKEVIRCLKRYVCAKSTEPCPPPRRPLQSPQHRRATPLDIHRSIPARFLSEQLRSASPDLLREMLTTFINTIMSAEADAVCGAAYGTSSPDRVNVRNGYRPREFDTRAGTWRSRSPSCGPARTFRTGCSSAAGEPSAR